MAAIEQAVTGGVSFALTDEQKELRSVAREFAASCKQRSGRELEDVATSDTVHDMDAIRAAIGEARISYMGFSYGTYHGARYADA